MTFNVAGLSLAAGPFRGGAIGGNRVAWPRHAHSARLHPLLRRA